MNQQFKSSLIIIAGGSASGKTSLANKIAEIFYDKNIIFIQMDNYYKDLKHLTLEQRKKVNFDHPSTFDMPLLINNLEQLMLGSKIKEPIYDFNLYTRSKETREIEPAEVIIFDGILALENNEIRNKANIKIFVDTDSDIRLLRRITRDVETRGRTLNSILEQYQATVKPMHDAFVEPTKKYADIIIPFDFHNSVAIDLIATKIKSIIK